MKLLPKQIETPDVVSYNKGLLGLAQGRRFVLPGVSRVVSVIGESTSKSQEPSNFGTEIAADPGRTGLDR